MYLVCKAFTELNVSIYFFALMQKSNKKNQGCIKKTTKFEYLAKMKLASSSEHIQTLVRLKDKLQSQAFGTSISFLNAMHSNFLNVFFMRPAERLRTKWIILYIYL